MTVDHDQVLQQIGVVLEGTDEHPALATQIVLVRDDDLDEDRVRARLANTLHLHEPERWIVLALEVNARGRAPTRRQAEDLHALFRQEVGGTFDACEFAELAYLEDALAVDARWMSWVPGRVEELLGVRLTPEPVLVGLEW